MRSRDSWRTAWCTMAGGILGHPIGISDDLCPRHITHMEKETASTRSPNEGSKQEKNTDLTAGTV